MDAALRKYEPTAATAAADLATYVREWVLTSRVRVAIPVLRSNDLGKNLNLLTYGCGAIDRSINTIAENPRLHASFGSSSPYTLSLRPGTPCIS